VNVFISIMVKLPARKSQVGRTFAKGVVAGSRETSRSRFLDSLNSRLCRYIEGSIWITVISQPRQT